jgi:uncharacterized membrane protein YphA (DoxX/SURF4 family)
MAPLFRSPAVRALALLALVAPFLTSGVAKLFDVPGAIGEVRGLTGLDQAGPLAALVIATQLGGAAVVLFGGWLRWVGCLALAGFTAVATLLAHAFWLKPPDEQALHFNIFFEHVAMVGGLLLAAGYRRDD